MFTSHSLKCTKYLLHTVYSVHLQGAKQLKIWANQEHKGSIGVLERGPYKLPLLTIFPQMLNYTNSILKKTQFYFLSNIQQTRPKPGAAPQTMSHMNSHIPTRNPILERGSAVLLLLLLRHAQGTPPWILKRGGLESSG